MSSPPGRSRRDHNITADPLTEVTVYAVILHDTAEFLELLHGFLTDAQPVVRTQLGHFLTERQPGTDAAIETAITLHELTEVADLLHTIAGCPADILEPNSESCHRPDDPWPPRAAKGPSDDR